MKIDFIEVLGDAFGTLFGRLLASLLVINLGMGLGLSLGSAEDLNLFSNQVVAIPYLFFSIVSAAGLIVLPTLFGFAILFTRYEWHFGFLAIPFLLALYLGFNF